MKLQENGAQVKGKATFAPVKEYTPAKFEPVWVETTNEVNAEAAIEMALKLDPGCMIQFVGNSGRGKTTISRKMASHKGYVYLLCLETWRRSEIPMLQTLCRELGMAKPPRRANEAFLAAAEKLIASPVPVFLDEMDLVPQRINLIRQLAEFAGNIFVLVGEESLSGHMQENQRVWSRTFQTVHFEPASVSDIIIHGRRSAGLEIASEAATLLHKSPGGHDWRVIKRYTINLVEIANVYRSRAVSKEMAQQAIAMSLKGKQRGSGS